ncbi:MAG: AMP-binding enzyme, partial [Parahaliea sp.]
AWNESWFCTGDAARYAAGGSLEIAGRKKHMIISGGVNIYPAEVERAMDQIEGLQEVLVFGRPHAKWGECVVAVVYGASDISLDRVLAASRQVLGPLKAPRRILRSPAPLPRTTSGKLSRDDPDGLFGRLEGCAQVSAD